MQLAPSPFALLIAASLGGGPGCVSGADRPVDQPAAASDLDLDTTTRREGAVPFLWRVEGPGAPSHLFGTIHLGIEADRELAPQIWREVDAARVVVVEVAPDDLASAAVAPSSFQPEGHFLDEELGPRAWQKLKHLMGPSGVEWLRPRSAWFAYTAVLRLLFPTQHPIDESIARRAQRRHIPIRGLETVDFQLQTLARFTTANAVSELLADNAEELRELRELVAAYRRGDAEAITHISAGDRSDAEYDRVVFRDRNRAWARELEPLLRTGGAFVAVGVGHLVGPDSLVSLLSQRGFKLVPASNSQH